MKIFETKFERNQANYFPNVISSSSNSIKIIKCIFKSNFPFGNFVSILQTKGRSGAIEIIKGNAMIFSSYFHNNSNNQGGAISAYYSPNNIEDSIFFVYKCYFENNSAVIGGALFLYTTWNLRIYITNSYFALSWAAQCINFDSFIFKTLNSRCGNQH